MKNKKMFCIYLIYYLCMLGVACIFTLGYFGLLEGEWLSNILIQCVVMFAVPILLYSIFVSKNIKQTFSDFGLKKVSFSIILCSIALGFVLYCVNSYVAQFFQAIIVILGYDSSIGVSLSVGGNVAKEFLLTAILPGICEEVCHRGLLLRGSQKQGYTRYGLIFSSLLFGLLHLNIQQFFYATILGSLMGIAVIVADSIIPSIIIHFMNNALSVYFSLGYECDLPFTKWRINFLTKLYSLPLFECVTAIVLMVAMLLGIYVLLLRIIANVRKRRKAVELAKGLKLEENSYEGLREGLSVVKVEVDEITKSRLVSVQDSGQPLSTLDKIFVYNGVLLGAMITFCSFIWGIL